MVESLGISFLRLMFSEDVVEMLWDNMKAGIQWLLWEHSHANTFSHESLLNYSYIFFCL